jgi:cell division protease FtsH
VIRRTYFGGQVRGGFLAAYAVAVAVGLVLFLALPEVGGAREVSFSELDRAIVAGDIRTAVLDEDARVIEVASSDGSRSRAAYPATIGAELAHRLLAAGVDVTVEPAAQLPTWVRAGAAVAPLAVLLVAAWAWSRLRAGGSTFPRGWTRQAAVPATRFADIGGMDEVVAELAEARDVLLGAEPYAAAGARAPRGFLLTGAPGTGKTLLARAVAGEAGVPFFAVSGADFADALPGVGAARVRRVFALARREGRAIVFIDEIDAAGRSRALPGGDGAEANRTLHQLLVEMDGFTPSSVLVLAATNRPDLLDPALRRPGRFDRTIAVPPPDRRGRTQILELAAVRHRFDADVDLVDLGRRTAGMTGADLAALVNEAALAAARGGGGDGTIGLRHLDGALATSVLGRERRSAEVSERDRRIVAWHEAGHAVCALLLPDADDPAQVTIVPRGDSGGTTWLTVGDDQLLTGAQARAQLVVAMGGRGGEELVLEGDVTGAAAHDYAAARALAGRMVTAYGMGARGVAHAGYDAAGPVPPEVAAAIDTLLQDSLAAARGILHGAAGLVEALAEELLVEETVALPRLRHLADHHR